MQKITKQNIPPLLLRCGLAFVLGYAAISSLISPDDWIGYLPKIATHFIAGDILLKVMSLFEIVLAGWLLSGIFVRYAAIVCALLLTGITVANLSLLPISFRDIGLVFMALALAFLNDPVMSES